MAMTLRASEHGGPADRKSTQTGQSSHPGLRALGLLGGDPVSEVMAPGLTVDSPIGSVPSSPPSSCRCGTTGSSHLGIHQARLPSSVMIAGTRIIRTSDASI